MKPDQNRRRKLQTRLTLLCTRFALRLATFIGGYGYFVHVIHFPDPAVFRTMNYVISATSSAILAENPDFFTAINTPGVIGDATDADHDEETTRLNDCLKASLT